MADRPGGVERLRSSLGENLPFSLWEHWRPIAAVAVLTIAALAWLADGSAPKQHPPPEVSLPRAVPAEPTPVEDLVLQVAGAVNEPGIVRLPPNARVNDAIQEAGGVTSEADVNRVNLAAKVSDGQRIFVPKVGEPAPAPMDGEGSTSGEAGDSIVDLNAASIDVLDKLPGVGPTTAKAIVDFRKANGPFRSVADLSKVKGIGPAKLDQIRPLVRV